jgi:hypothetical protein
MGGPATALLEFVISSKIARLNRNKDRAGAGFLPADPSIAVTFKTCKHAIPGGWGADENRNNARKRLRQ